MIKKLLSIFTVISLISSVSFADCDFSTGITKTDHNTYEYSKDCHIAVGQMKVDLGVAKQQLVDYKAALDLKDTALDKATQRANMWMDTSFKLEDRNQSIENAVKTNQWLYFGLGVVVTGFAVYGAAKLSGH